MENHDLKERIRKNVKEKIAVSNIREEFDMKNKKSRKLIYGIASSAAVFLLGSGIMLGMTHHGRNNTPYGISDLQNVNKESLKIELNIYKIASLMSSDMDVKMEYYSSKLPENIWKEILEEFKECMGISKNEFETKIPDKFIETNFYTIKIPGYKGTKSSDEYKKHDYVFEYKAENDGEVRIALCKKEKPLRDYYFEFKGKKSQIGNTELEISQYNNKYMVAFEFHNVNYDIEATDITENELLELLQSILTENSNKNTSIEDGDVNVKEQSQSITSANYPDYYAGRYVDDHGNNVVLLCRDNEVNRKEICSLLGITEGKTIFKIAKYSYNYLTDLQNKISKKMIDKEFTFVTTSSVMEDKNNIKVTVISSNESDLDQIKALDTIGGAIDIEYNTNGSAKEDLLIEKE